MKSHIILLGIYSATSLILSLALVRGMKFYFEKIVPELNRSIRFRKLYAPWVFLLIFGLFLQKWTLKVLDPFDQELTVNLLKSMVLFSSVMVVTQSRFLLKLMIHKYIDYKGMDDFRKRSISTQFQFIEKVLLIAVWTIAIATTLDIFQGGRNLAKSLLASAGVLGVVIGFAAQKSLANLMAGFQIAFTQPIRLDDVVFVENQWGKVEKITLTYVVICLWDLRRLVVPIHYFIEKPFENWTKTGSEIIGHIFILVDYSFPVDSIRKEFESLLRKSKLWNGKTSLVQVTDLTEKGMTLRFLMSANTASEAFDLRCQMRERLILFIQKNYPDCLPMVRFEAKLKEESGRVYKPFEANLVQ